VSARAQCSKDYCKLTLKRVWQQVVQVMNDFGVFIFFENYFRLCNIFV